jgi:hypothetical protein
MATVHELTPALGAGAACRAVGLWRERPRVNAPRPGAPPLSGLSYHAHLAHARRWR